MSIKAGQLFIVSTLDKLFLLLSCEPIFSHKASEVVVYRSYLRNRQNSFTGFEYFCGFASFNEQNCATKKHFRLKIIPFTSTNIASLIIIMMFLFGSFSFQVFTKNTDLKVAYVKKIAYKLLINANIIIRCKARAVNCAVS